MACQAMARAADWPRRDPAECRERRGPISCHHLHTPRLLVGPTSRPHRQGGSLLSMRTPRRRAARRRVPCHPGVPLPYRRPWNEPQAAPIGTSQQTPWSPNVSGFTPATVRPAFNARWSSAAPPASLLDMSNVPSPLSEQVPKLSADGTVDPRYVYSYFLNRGFNTAQAAALVGNKMRESYDLKPD